MKKLISFLLALATLLITPIPVFAVGDTNYEDNSIEIVTPDPFLSVFSPGTQSTHSFSQESPKVSYSYTFTKSDENPDTAYVSLCFDIEVGSQIYPMNVSGIVNSYLFSDGTTLWEGPIRGSSTISGKPYNIIVGFVKEDSLSSITANVTLQSTGGEYPVEPICFTFGDYLLPPQVCNELGLDSDTLNTPQDSSPRFVATASDPFKLMGSMLATFPDSMPAGYAQAVRGHFNPITKQFAVSIQTYGDVLTRWATSKSLCTPKTVVDSFEIRLAEKSESDYSHSWIDGIEAFDFNVANLGKSTLIKPIFEDMLSLKGVPTSTISAIFDGLKGTVTKERYTDTAKVRIEFGLSDSADFDSCTAGIPIVFQLDYAPDTYTGNSKYTFSSSITYRTYMWYSSASTPRWYYHDANDASKTVTFSLAS